MLNGGSASTAELLAASLHDNQRATLLGEKTFGKGRTQRVIPLRGNALLLLSNTTYLTPRHQVVDKVSHFLGNVLYLDLTNFIFVSALTMHI